MPKLPRQSGAEMVRFLASQGFVVEKIRGSQYILVKGELHTVVPVHASDALRIGALRGILRDVDIRPTQFCERSNG